MAKWCASLALIAALAGGALAGVPMHSGERGCPMTGMADCCRKAQAHGNAPAVRAARLCCALNCTSPGTTAPAGGFQFSPSPAVVLQGAGSPRPAAAVSVKLLRNDSLPGSRQDSRPAYIRHLALLI